MIRIAIEKDKIQKNSQKKENFYGTGQKQKSWESPKRLFVEA